MSSLGPRWLLALLLFAAASIAIHYQVKERMGAGASGSSATGKLKRGDAAPEFSLPDLAGQPVALASFRGRKVVVLDFWATWCGPCRQAMPGLQALHDDLGSQGVELVAIDVAEPADRVRAFIERKRYTFRTVLDAPGAVGSEYGVRGLPTMVVVDKQGIVRRISAGYTHDDKALRKMLQALAAEP